jgi:excisionase family DNA binding protein
MNSLLNTGSSDGEQLGNGGPLRMAFSVQETADRLGVCPASIYRALKRGDLEAVTLGGRRLIPRRSIEKLLSTTPA